MLIFFQQLHQVLNYGLVLLVDESNPLPGLPSATCSPNSMNVVLYIARHVVVDDNLYTFYVKAPCCDVSSD